MQMDKLKSRMTRQENAESKAEPNRDFRLLCIICRSSLLKTRFNEDALLPHSTAQDPQDGYDARKESFFAAGIPENGSSRHRSATPNPRTW